MRRVIVWMALCLVATACGGGSASGSAAASGSTGSGTALTVFAASSLTGAFQEIGSQFEQANAGTTVTFNFGSSTDLASQIASEGTADVFASASGTAMDAVASDPGVTGRTDFATNELVVIVPSDNPANITSLVDLGNGGVQVVIGAEGVPVGDYAREMLTNAGIEQVVMANVVSNEPDDASIVAKVTSGEADAGILVCGTGIGMSIVANKHNGVRAGNVESVEGARMARAHNNANVLAIGARLTPWEKAEEIIKTFLATAFEGGRHQRRVDKIHTLTNL